eukprot:PhM_4_TR9975/c0_g1_i1/m.13512
MSQPRFEGEITLYAAFDADDAGNYKGDYGNIGFVLVEPGDTFDLRYAVWIYEGTASGGKWKRSDGVIHQEDLAKRYIRHVQLPLSTRRLSQATINDITERGTLYQLGEKRFVALREGKVVTARPKLLRADHVLADVFRDVGPNIETKGVRIPYDRIVIPARLDDVMGEGVTALSDLVPDQRAELIQLAESLHRPVVRIPMNVAHLRAPVEHDHEAMNMDPRVLQGQQQQHQPWNNLVSQVHADGPGTELTVMLHLLGVAPIGPVRVRLLEPGKTQLFCASLPTLDGRSMPWPPPPVLEGRAMHYEVLSTAKPTQSADAQRTWTSAISARQTSIWYDVMTWGSWLDMAGDAIEPQIHLLRSWVCTENHTNASDRTSDRALLLDNVM